LIYGKIEKERGVKEEIRVGSDDRSEEKDSAEPVLGDLVVDLAREILPKPRHHLLLER
jgi:hypothetical protein